MNFDPAAVVASVDAWAHAHPYILTALAAASAHRKAIFTHVVLAAVKRWPWLLGKESEILADVDEFRADLKESLDEAAAAKAAADQAASGAAKGLQDAYPAPAAPPAKP
jgi:hypothetical protein